MKTYSLKKGTFIRLVDGREAVLCDSARRMTRRVKTSEAKLESICSFDICAYRSGDGTWNHDLEYSDEEVSQRERRKPLGQP